MKLDHLPLFEDEGREGAAESHAYVSKKEESCAIIQWGGAAAADEYF